MAVLLKLGIVTLLMTLALAATQQNERERRFLLDNIVSGATAIKDGVADTFFRVFGGKFKVKDAGSTLRAADTLRSHGHTISDMAEWYAAAAKGYRRSMYHEDAYRHLNEWESAARLLTQLGDEMSNSDRELINFSTWIRLTVTSSLTDARLKDRFTTVLDRIRLAVERLETLLPEVRAALTNLKDVAAADATEDIEKTLQKMTKTEDIIKKARVDYDSLDKAVGLNN
ncbi:hypothetical protein RRG08_016428 [Elysia crispata]|uniref:Uncharacterized protein n=1 Tax=Elysia crispata TaxID=231223 RepID=A0AAE1CUK0_9GAST|nr:hypothetical protein RRG08_016428 [Elysia crispata]